jgi:hypothetical protein
MEGRAPRRRTRERKPANCGTRTPSFPAIAGFGHNLDRVVSNESVTYLVGACLGVLGLAAFCTFIVVPAITSYRRPLQRVAAVFLSFYVLAALMGIGVLLGALIIVEWPRVF